MAFCVAWQAHAADVKVVANSSVAATSVSAGDLKDVFLLDKDSLGGSHVDPVLIKGGAAHEVFIKLYLGKRHCRLLIPAWYLPGMLMPRLRLRRRGRGLRGEDQGRGRICKRRRKHRRRQDAGSEVGAIQKWRVTPRLASHDVDQTCGKVTQCLSK